MVSSGRSRAVVEGRKGWVSLDMELLPSYLVVNKD